MRKFAPRTVARNSEAHPNIEACYLNAWQWALGNGRSQTPSAGKRRAPYRSASLVLLGNTKASHSASSRKYRKGSMQSSPSPLVARRMTP